MKLMMKPMFIILILICGSSLFILTGQESEGADPVQIEEILPSDDNLEVSKSGSAFGSRLVSPALEIEAAMFGLTPIFSVYADFGFRLTPEIIIAPRVGFTYCLPLLETTLEEMSLPVGVRVSLPRTLYVEGQYYLPLDFSFERLRFRFAAGGEAIVAAGAGAAFGINAGLGMGVFVFTDTDELLFPVSFKMGFRLYF